VLPRQNMAEFDALWYSNLDARPGVCCSCLHNREGIAATMAAF
jgi:hypothetical protein